MDVSFIPPTSNMVERLFSTAKLIYSDLRHSTKPEVLEAILFLHVNESMRDKCCQISLYTGKYLQRKEAALLTQDAGTI
jgi:hypothetical protein